MSFFEDQKIYLEGLRSELKTRKNTESDREEEQAVSFLNPIVHDLLELNDYQTRLHKQSKVLRNGHPVVKVLKNAFGVQSSYDSQNAHKKRIRRRLRRHTSKIYESLLTLRIDRSPYLLDLLPAEAVSTEQPETDHKGYVAAARPQQQPSSVASSKKTTPDIKNNTPYHYHPTSEDHGRMATIVRDIGVIANWKKVAARIDEHYPHDIPFIVPGYFNSLPKDKRPPLLKALKQSSQMRARFQRVLRDVRKEIRREQASQQLQLDMAEADQ